MPLANLPRFYSLRTSLHFLSLKRCLSFLSLPPLISTHQQQQQQPFSLSYSVAAVSAKMEAQSLCVLILSGKSSTEMEVAKSLRNNASLKLPDNAEISLSLYSEMGNALEDDSFQVNTYMDSLLTTSFGRFLLWSPKLPSTHDVVSQQQLLSAPDWRSLCCRYSIQRTRFGICSLQYSVGLFLFGRARNVWESPKGCLLFSFTLQMEDGRVVPLVQYVVSLAMTEAIKEVSQKNGVPPLDVRIKWPNDLYLDGLKVGGILCTSTYRSKKFNVSAGIGLNVDNDKPTTSLNAVLRKWTSISSQLQREDILSAFFNKFENMFHLLIHQGFKPLEELYYKTWLHNGQRVIVQEKNEDQDELVEKVVTVQGLTSSGYLLAIGDDGQMCGLHPDGNSLQPVSFRDVRSFVLEEAVKVAEVQK